MASNLTVTVIASLIVAGVTSGGGLIFVNYRRGTTNRNNIIDMQDRLEAIEQQSEQTARLVTAAAYSLDQVIQRLNGHDDLHVDLDEVHFRDDFLRGGTDTQASPDGGQLGPHEHETLEEYYQRLYPTTNSSD